jgi:transposase
LGPFRRHGCVCHSFAFSERKGATRSIAWAIDGGVDTQGPQQFVGTNQSADAYLTDLKDGAKGEPSGHRFRFVVRLGPSGHPRFPLMTGHLDWEVIMSVMEQLLLDRVRRSFTDEFKADAVSMVLDDERRIVDVADALGIGDGTLGNWVRQARTDRGEREGLTTEEKAELARLRKENARLRMERDLLKRATAFWVKESGQ